MFISNTLESVSVKRLLKIFLEKTMSFKSNEVLLEPTWTADKGIRDSFLFNSFLFEGTPNCIRTSKYRVEWSHGWKRNSKRRDAFYREFSRTDPNILNGLSTFRKIFPMPCIALGYVRSCLYDERKKIKRNEFYYGRDRWKIHASIIIMIRSN